MTHCDPMNLKWYNMYSVIVIQFQLPTFSIGSCMIISSFCGKVISAWNIKETVRKSLIEWQKVHFKVKDKVNKSIHIE